jgi:2-(1,2-epoxy-1,2-dihydrophenyl)acetyl-CoA isomerase
MSQPVLLIEQQEHVRLLRLNRPDKKNALSEELGWAIVEAIEAAATDDSVRVVGLTGAGDAFCSGLDLSPTPNAGDSEPTAPLSPQDALLDDYGWVGRFPLSMRSHCDKPVVAGVNGVAVGAGLSLAMSADIRVASSRARFLAGYSRAGTSPDGGLSWTLPQAIGYERALRFLLEGDMHSADEALALGIVGEIVEAENFEARFVDYCHQLATVAPIAARQTKRMVGRAVEPVRLEGFVRDELNNARRGLRSEDGREAMQAIIEKRKPEFRGR